jgi:hypothetical protein
MENGNEESRPYDHRTEGGLPRVQNQDCCGVGAELQENIFLCAAKNDLEVLHHGTER